MIMIGTERPKLSKLIVVGIGISWANTYIIGFSRLAQGHSGFVRFSYI